MTLNQIGEDPFTLVIENAHDMDVSSWDFLRYHIGSDAPSGELWIATHRPLTSVVHPHTHLHTHFDTHTHIYSNICSRLRPARSSHPSQSCSRSRACVA